jgi:carbon-monoxide dehydrogenase medium subunit
MLAVDAELQLKGLKGWRMVKASDFFTDALTVDLAPDELIVNVRLTPSPASAYAKLKQRASHFAIVGVAVAIEVEGGVIRRARVGVTGAGPRATRLSAVEQALTGKPATPETADAAGALATLDQVNADIHASEAYRRAMIPVFTRRAVKRALARA